MAKLETSEQQNTTRQQVDGRFQQQQLFARNDSDKKNTQLHDINSFTNINFNNYADYRDEEEGVSQSSSASSSSSSSDSSATSASLSKSRHSSTKKSLFKDRTKIHRDHYSKLPKNHKKRCSKQATLAGVLWKKFTKVGLKVMKVSIYLLVINLIIYHWPMGSPEIESKISAYKPRPKFAGPLAINNLLDSSDTLFSGQFHAPESMAWKKDKRSFYTGVEGGFILLVEPYKERWQVIAKLNARNSIYDQSNRIQLILPYTTVQLNSSTNNNEQQMIATTAVNNSTLEPTKVETLFVDYCTRDAELYGKRAEFEPQLVSLSRCSRPLGIRLSPDETYLYVNDAIAGLFRVEFFESKNSSASNRRYELNQVTKLIDYKSSLERKYMGNELDDQRLFFSDDIAVDWGAGKDGGDVVYMTDCSKRWNVRFLIRVILENDDTGRVLSFDVNERTLKPLDTIVPTLVKPEQQYYANNNSKVNDNDDELITKSVNINGIGEGILDWRNLSFPNGVELTSNKSALLISDLNNRRIIMHHLKGMLKGQSVHLLWVPGFSDNIRRGLDETGEATYWTACGCAVEDGYIEMTEFLNDLPILRKLFLKFAHIIGSAIETLGNFLYSTSLLDAGFMIKSIWLKIDPYCTHGIVIQFNEQGKILRSLHAPHFISDYKLLSEAHQVPLFDDHSNQEVSNNNNGSITSALYLGSVYYSYLGRIKL